MRTICFLVACSLLAGACSNTRQTVNTDAAESSTTVADGTTPAPETSTITTTTGTSTTTTSTSSSTTSTSSSTTTTTLDRELSDERMQSDLAALVDLGVREAGSEAEQQAAVLIEQTLRNLSAAVSIGEVPLPDRAASVNVLASFGEGEIHVLLGAHFDSKPPSPGADDNGSGVVVLLELARRLAEEPPDAGRVTLAFFGAEEFLIGVEGNAHHFGSRQLADQMAADGDLPDLMVSVDMVGVGGQLLAVTYLDTYISAAMLISEAAAGLGLTVPIEARGDISDHEAFARHGVPAAFLWRPDNPDYHLASDLEVRSAALQEDLEILEAFLELAGL